MCACSRSGGWLARHSWGWLASTVGVAAYHHARGAPALHLTASAPLLLCSSAPRRLWLRPRRLSAPTLHGHPALARPLLGQRTGTAVAGSTLPRGTARLARPLPGDLLARPLHACDALRNRCASARAGSLGTHVAHRLCSAPSRISGTHPPRWPTIDPQPSESRPYVGMGDGLRIDPEPNAVFSLNLPKSRSAGTPVASRARSYPGAGPDGRDLRLGASAKRFLQNDGRIVAWMRLCGTIYVLER